MKSIYVGGCVTVRIADCCLYWGLRVLCIYVYRLCLKWNKGVCYVFCIGVVLFFVMGVLVDEYWG
jgi:hypothetical protein